MRKQKGVVIGDAKAADIAGLRHTPGAGNSQHQHNDAFHKEVDLRCMKK
jgi:hypothetical protein